MSEAISSPVIGRVGYLILDREHTLNALDLDMCIALSEALEHHQTNPAVEIILIRSGNARAFCAGGDMKRIRNLVLSDQLDEVENFFRIEYALNLAIAESSKPYVSLIDGVAMGGGLGVSVHGSHVVLSERAVLAMPETRIGLFPDVGGTYFLPRLAQQAGRWLALTSEALKGHEAVTVGLATHAIASSDCDALCAALETGTGSVDNILAQYQSAVDETELRERIDTRQAWFTPPSLEGMLDALDTAASDVADSLAVKIRSGSPAAMEHTLVLFAANAKASLATALNREYIAMCSAIRHPDFAEGVRAILVDKDHAPKWQKT